MQWAYSELFQNYSGAEVATYLAQSSDARKELAEIQGDLAIYAHTVDLHSPPAQVRERLMKQVAREKKAVPIDRPAVAETRAPEAAVRPGTIFTESGAIVPSYVTEEIAPKRGIAGKVLPWIGWAVAAGLAVTTGEPAWAVWGVLMSGFIIVSHKDNIERLLAGTERKLGERAERSV